MYSKWKFTLFPFKFMSAAGTIRTTLGSERISQDRVSIFFLGYFVDNQLGICKKQQSPYGVGGQFVSEVDLITQNVVV